MSTAETPTRGEILMKPSTRSFLLGAGAGCAFAVVAGALIATALGFWAATLMSELSDSGPGSGLPTPPVPTLIETLDYSWHLHSPEGERVRMADLQGKPLVLNFWATWCRPCVRELPQLERLAESFSDDEVAFLLLSEEPTDTLRDFIEEQGLKLPVARVAEAPDGTTFPRPIPTTWIVDSAGKIVFRHTGAADWADEAVVQYLKILSEGSP